jgi:cystathionine beta-synthase
LSIAYSRMRLHDVSQVPVLDGRAIVGILDESDLLVAVSRDPRAFDEPVSQHMTTRLQTVSPQDSLDVLRPVFEAGRVAIVVDASGFQGLITRVDVLNYLRQLRRAA